MPSRPRATTRACLPTLALALAIPAAARAEDRPKPDPTNPDVVVTGAKPRPPAPVPTASTASIDADRIAATVNAISVEQTLKYLPSLIIRQRHIGDTQAPLATRTSGLGASARSLIYADGALLSALIGNNNTIASPRWGLVSTEEIARVDVLYGPFSAQYPGNSIGAVVNITTRLPDRLEATATAAMNVQQSDLYGQRETLPTHQLGATIGDRFGPLSVFVSVDHVDSHAQPLLLVTAPQPAGASAAGTPVTGAVADVNRLGAPIRVLGANAIEHQVQDRVKLKAALDIAPGVRLTYVGALFGNDTTASAESYLTNAATGATAYAGSFNIDGRLYPVAASAFSGGVYRYTERHWSHALSATGTGDRFDWQAIGTLYRFGHDVQRIPTTALPDALAGGAGTITRLDGTGWATLDLKGAWRSDADATNTLSAGLHADRFTLASNRYATTDWLTGTQGQLNLRSAGRTRTIAGWAEDAVRIAAPLTLTAGVRVESWTADRGQNFSLTPAIFANQPVEQVTRASPKASLAWAPVAGWTVRGSFGDAWRFPTVGELYQIVTTPVAAVPNPNLRPEHALSEELAVERRDAHGTARVSLFNEIVTGALVSQTGTIVVNGAAALGTFVQNVDRTRARGVEAAVDRRDVLPRIDLTASVTYADAITRADAAFPAAVGHAIPGVPHWKATLVGTWRPTDAVSLTAAGRYASRIYGTLDGSDIVGNTYGGFYQYLVVDLRAEFRVGEHYRLGLGVDNVGDDRYYLFHPFPQRSFQADLRWSL
ncbi:TonB-dependent receptor [uncultured Sphingomonas sp.]|uniref:TonB-dependent receptor n=1 Tax=uncultured Sphingomonas sp. TaxID=158754 RepID=UPI0035CA0E54